MLRLCEIENQELKNSLRYVEIQLAKTKEAKREVTEKYESAQNEIEKCHEQIQRGANVQSAQARQIEDMGQQLDGVAASQKEVHEKTKLQIKQYQGEIDIREMEINRIKKVLEQRDGDIVHLTTQNNMQKERLEEIDVELELKSGENNRLRKQVADLEAAMQDLYCSRKGNGSLQIELDSLKADNEKLLELLKETTEYADLDADQIVRAAQNKVVQSLTTAGSLKSGKSDGKSASSKGKKDNDWIPTQAVRAINKIRDDFSGKMTETCVSQILYELNSIWRQIMRKENEAIKKRLTAQIQDLRRQVVTKNAFDKGELMQEISRTKKELAFAHKTIHNKKAQADSSVNHSVTNQDEIHQSMRLVETIGIQKKVLEDENEELKSRISELMNEKSAFSTSTPIDRAAEAALQARENIPSLNLQGYNGQY